ncbi:hypothetical protein B0J13DRAFT_528343 [Dactylonectria estremocensis]|uniref:Uncharacterized protein n=1 Tax=Dactylonectria estremocensis TaxID=1079267 RepID=A0A9P9ECI7_9HYPO|nr:hypothetical protein B0J13DRAFT_528343 [Dactylonectria estremocensis]
MCYQLVELYSACLCLYYQFAIDRCADYGRPGHNVIQRTVLVGYACSMHSGDTVTNRYNDADNDTEVKTDVDTDTDTDIMDMSSVASTEMTTPDVIKEDTIGALLQEFLVEPDLQYLWPQVVHFSVAKHVARRNIAKLFQNHAHDLQQEGQSALKTKASLFIRRHRYKIAGHIVDHYQAEIEDQSAKPKSHGPLSTVETASDGLQDEDQGDDDEKDFLYSEIHGFLFSSISFDNLKTSVKLVVASSSFSETPGQVFVTMTIVDAFQLMALNVFSGLFGHVAKPGLTRVWHDNRLTKALQGCGRALYDDFAERRPGSVADLKTFIQGYGSPILTKGPLKTTSFALLQGEGGNAKPSSQGSKFLFSELQRVFRNMSQVRKPGKLPQEESKLSDLDLSFELFRNELVNIRSSASMPGAHTQAEYDYEPSDTDPPIGPNMLLHLFENPEHADVLPVLFRRFPKKKLRRLQACSRKGYSVGWGVQFVESFNGQAVFVCGCVGFCLCLFVSILWTVLKGDIQGGFGVGAFVLAFFRLHFIGDTLCLIKDEPKTY